MGARMCPCLLAGQWCVYVTLDNKPEVDDEMEMDTQTAQSNQNYGTKLPV